MAEKLQFEGQQKSHNNYSSENTAVPKRSWSTRLSTLFNQSGSRSFNVSNYAQQTVQDIEKNSIEQDQNVSYQNIMHKDDSISIGSLNEQDIKIEEIKCENKELKKIFWAINKQRGMDQIKQMIDQTQFKNLDQEITEINQDQIRNEIKESFISLINFKSFMKTLSKGKVPREQNGFLKLYQDKDQMKSPTMISLYDFKCAHILLNQKVIVYQKKIRKFLIRYFDWHFTINQLKNYHDRIFEFLKSEFENELLMARIRYDRQLFFQVFEIEYQNFENGLNYLIDYRDKWVNHFNYGVIYTNQAQLTQINSELIENLTENYRNCNQNWIFNIQNRLYQMISLENEENFKIDLDTMTKNLESNITEKFEDFLRTGYYNEFQTRKLFRNIINMAIDKIGSIVTSDMIQETIFISYQDKLKELLIEHQDQFILRQRNLYEKVETLIKKCEKESIDLYLNSIEKSDLKLCKLDESNMNKIDQEINQHICSVLSNLKDHFTDKYFEILGKEIRETIEIKLNEKKHEMIKIQSSKNKKIKAIKSELLDICKKLEKLMETNDNITGIKRLQITEEIEKTHKILETNDSLEVFENQRLNLDDLCKYYSFNLE